MAQDFPPGRGRLNLDTMRSTRAIYSQRNSITLKTRSWSSSTLSLPEMARLTKSVQTCPETSGPVIRHSPVKCSSVFSRTLNGGILAGVSLSSASEPCLILFFKASAYRVQYSCVQTVESSHLKYHGFSRLWQYWILVFWWRYSKIRRCLIRCRTRGLSLIHI